MLYYVFFSQKSEHLKQMVTNMRVTLECFKTVTYNIDSNVSFDTLEGVQAKLSTLLKEFQEQLPQSHGLLIRPQMRKQMKRSFRRKVTLKRLAQLPKCATRRKKNDSRFRGRVGKKASILRKVCVCKICIIILDMFI